MTAELLALVVSAISRHVICCETMDVLSFVSLRVNLSDLQRFSVHEKYKMQIYSMFLKMKTVFIALIRGRVLLDLSDMQY